MNEIQGMKNPNLVKLLIEMERMFRKACENNRADYLKNLVELLRSDSQKALKELASNTFWGGSGSYIDHVPNFGPNETETYSVKNYYCTLLELLLTLRAEGYTHPWFDDREKTLKNFIKLYD